jgi:predicted AlkP superfamily pyrophosphatase or phosphodiesterase
LTSAVARRKVVLIVVDGLGRAVFERAVAEGRAPTIAQLLERGTLHAPCASSFPSLTPVCLSAIATGRHPDGSFIPGLTWYRRGEGRFVEYGSSFGATLVEGTLESVNDSMLNLNHLHLSQQVRTVFEAVEDAGLVAGAINFYVFRGRTRHPLAHRPLGALARRIGFTDAVYGPSRFFFGELFQSDMTGAPPNIGLGGGNDRHAAAVGRWLVARDGFDFLLFYLPEVDMASHRSGPDEVLEAVGRADEAIAELVSPCGGVDGFLERYAVVLVADHGQSRVTETTDLRDALEGLRLFTSSRASDPARSAVALAASNRAGMLYRLTDAPSARTLAGRLEELPGVDLVAFREGSLHVVRRAGRELRFSRDEGGRPDRRHTRWSIAGDGDVLELEGEGGLSSRRYPNPLERLAGLLDSVNAGEVVCSAALGHEFLDAGGSHHLGGGSHGSLLAEDSTVPLVTAGLDAPGALPAEPSITDVRGLVLGALGLSAAVEGRSVAR